MLSNEKILVTGVTGKIAFPIARALAGSNEVCGVARMREPGTRERLESAGIRPLAMDIAAGDFHRHRFFGGADPFFVFVGE